VIIHDFISPVQEPVTAITDTKLISINPNPISNNADVNFSISNNASVRIDVIDALGNIVAQIDNGQYIPGAYTIQWTARDNAGNELPSGSYTCRLVSGSVTSAIPMVIVK
jgi:flagellar hook assembly protein FlgD